MGVAGSVVIAARNAEPFLASALDSALGQTLRDLEVIVVDDASSDGTWGVIAAAAARDRRIVPVRLPRHSGPSAARNHGMAVASGRWVAVLDADDRFRPERLERLVTAAEACGADLIADNLVERDFDSGVELGTCLPDAVMRRTGPLSLAELVQRDMPDAPGRSKIGYIKPVFRRDFLRAAGLRYQEDQRVGEDFLLYFECLAHGARLHLVPEAMYVLSRRPGSISTRRDGTLHDHARANRRMLRLAGRLHAHDAALRAALRRRQRLLDAESFALFLEQRHLLNALRLVPGADVRGVMRALRANAAAAWRGSGSACTARSLLPFAMVA